MIWLLIIGVIGLFLTPYRHRKHTQQDDCNIDSFMYDSSCPLDHHFYHENNPWVDDCDISRSMYDPSCPMYWIFNHTDFSSWD
ncbi:hypothetical protein [Hydrogenobacter hydrogenophilus]|uniref:Uncharacterized protein n=1 Tax=Hydrogenobacter hydrogenophilus TaxID=35835 RepID=A0A285NME8_9AQUI|nr:hypothetical protein [Hydrogenobacter hydrogenophilus]SNZ10672.1 hypothetical protein SAMN06265353_0017 [Hydrogenobacter hydrogenophilus]